MTAISNEELDEILSLEVPKAGDAVIQNYLSGRDALIAEEKKQRSDHSFRQGLSPIARKACAIVSRIRAEEQRKVWTADLEEKIARNEPGVIVHPGMMFSLAKETMEKTKLWQIVHRMPKGALLHAHLDAMVDFDYLLNVVMETPGMHIASLDTHLGTPETRREANVSIRFKEQREGDVEPGAGRSIWSDQEGEYKPGTYILLTRAADAFPEGGRQGFLRWLKSRCTLSQTDAMEQHHGPAEIWRKFMKCFGVIASFLHYEPVWRAFLRRLMSLLMADGVFWTEIRFTWPLDYCRQGSSTPEPDYTAMFEVLEEEVARFKATPEGAGFWGIRTIWTCHRALSTRPLIADMLACIETKLAFPHLISGYDLVGLEDDGRPLVDVLPELFWFRKQCAAEGVEIPFFFHAGETLEDGGPTDQNLFDAILLGTRRIGHGFSLYKHPRLVEAVKDKKILIESCPISNEMLRLTGSIMQHPLPALLSRGVACALCNDDPAILGQDTAGMTHDFWQALQGWENLGLEGLGSLAENSVRWAAFEDESPAEWVKGVRAASTAGSSGPEGKGTIKAERLKDWAVRWEQFCLWVVTEFGEAYGEDVDVVAVEEGEDEEDGGGADVAA